MTLPIVQIKRLSKTFHLKGPWPWSATRDVVAIKPMDLVIAPGDVLAVVGQSGSGKTTLSRIVLGLELPTSGEIWLEDQRWDTLPEVERHRRRIAYQYVPQDAMSALDPQQTAQEHVEETLRVLAHKPRLDARVEAERILTHLGLQHRRAALPREMSGGEQRRVTLARVLALRPRLVVADEPTSGLDPDRREEVLRDLVGNLPEGSACILVTHDMSAARDWCTRAIVMLDGHVIETFDPRTEEPVHPYGRSLYAPWDVPLAREGLAPTGCPYHLDCPLAKASSTQTATSASCRGVMPALLALGSSGRTVACHALVPSRGEPEIHPSSMQEVNDVPA